MKELYRSQPENEAAQPLAFAVRPRSPAQERIGSRTEVRRVQLELRPNVFPLGGAFQVRNVH